MRQIVCITALLWIALLGTARAQEAPPDIGYTAHRADGNRLVSGVGGFPDVTAYRVPMPVPVAYLVPVPGRAAWVAIDFEGRAFHLALGNGGLTAREIDAPRAPRPTPYLDEAGTLRFAPAIEDASPLVPAVRYGDSWLVVGENGDLLRADVDGTILQRWALNLAPDVVPVVSEQARVAVYAEATDARYVHNIMGDRLEHAGLAVLAPAEDGTLQLIGRVALPGDQVFEGLSPLWADVTADSTPDLITTVSDGRNGAQVQVYAASGALLATGPAIGQGLRWRHQLAWGPFGADGENGLVEVLTPHIGGVVGFFSLQDATLVRAAALPGYTSHIINDRNVDMAVAGDFNGDGTPEIVLPNQARDRVAGLQVSGATFVEVWSLPVEGQVITNLAATTILGDRLALAVGTQESIYMWVPG
ncbi:MAG: hypothetical protein ACLFTK_06945 [Anaerolineales bacterium]